MAGCAGSMTHPYLSVAESVTLKFFRNDDCEDYTLHREERNPGIA